MKVEGAVTVTAWVPLPSESVSREICWAAAADDEKRRRRRRRRGRGRGGASGGGEGGARVPILDVVRRARCCCGVRV